jgi:chromosome segregation ATPase
MTYWSRPKLSNGVDEAAAFDMAMARTVDSFQAIDAAHKEHITELLSELQRSKAHADELNLEISRLGAPIAHLALCLGLPDMSDMVPVSTEIQRLQTKVYGHTKEMSAQFDAAAETITGLQHEKAVLQHEKAVLQLRNNELEAQHKTWLSHELVKGEDQNIKPALFTSSVEALRLATEARARDHSAATARDAAKTRDRIDALERRADHHDANWPRFDSGVETIRNQLADLERRMNDVAELTRQHHVRLGGINE